ncbi:hypothetical protein BDA96_07G059500 [Sorghum bicolor]|uniref:Uncharacterized protein n=2 Tax=Sorghum bicolor TaxID=4558 RepID=C5YHJ4_SORBI|nr:hypothetical protein SORBI_3007G057000 [Sorghum bicolor]KAG0522693.1 hypothetical protein BDA96_07G059500 [Sorghum bicolor]
MAKLAAQLKNKFFGLVGRITSCGRAGGAAHKDAAGVTETKSVASQPVEIRTRGGSPPVNGGSSGHIHSDDI